MIQNELQRYQASTQGTGYRCDTNLGLKSPGSYSYFNVSDGLSVAAFRV